MSLTLRSAAISSLFILAIVSVALGFTSAKLSSLRRLPPFQGSESVLGQSEWQPHGFAGIEWPESLRFLDRRGSWVAGDAYVGEHVSGWYRPGPHPALALAGYPAAGGNRLEIEVRRHDGRTSVIPFSGDNPRERWLAWTLPLPADTAAFRIHATDASTGMGGWLAFSEPFSAPPARTFDFRMTIQTFGAVALALVLVIGPGLVTRSFFPALSPVNVLWPGPVALALGGCACWALGGSGVPKVVALAWVGLMLGTTGWLGFRHRIWHRWTSLETQVLALMAVCVLGAAAKAAFSGGPSGELYGGSISRTLEPGGRSDSRISYHMVQVVTHHLSPYEPEAAKYFSPWTFGARGPLAGLIAAPIVLATGGQPPLSMPDQAWAPFDREGFAAYRITLMTLSSLALFVVMALLLRLAGDAAARFGIALLALAPFFWHELYFSWPKLVAATCVLGAFHALMDRRACVSALWLGAGYLCHPLALLSAPFLGGWFILQGGDSVRARFLRGAVFGTVVLAAVIAWQAANGFRPGQGGFLQYARAADSVYDVPARLWWLSRYRSFAHTFVPFYPLWNAAEAAPFDASGRPAPAVVRFFTQYWTTAPFALGLLTTVVLTPVLVRALFRQWRVSLAVLVGPIVFLTLYWGATITGLMREAGHVLFLSLCVFAPWAASLQLPRGIFSRSFSIVRATEVFALMFIPAFAAGLWRCDWLLGDIVWLALATACLAIAAKLTCDIATTPSAPEFDSPQPERCHLQEQPAVAEARDVRLAVSAIFVTDGNVANTQLEERGTK